MRRRHIHDHSKEHEAKIDLTPMIDVVFLLVMFFVLTSSFVLLEEVQLPVALQATDNPDVNDRCEAPILINITMSKDEDRTGDIKFNRETMTPKELVLALQAEARYHAQKCGWDDPNKTPKLSKMNVRIRADQGLQGQYLRQVFDSCQKAGLWKIKLSAMQD